MKNTFTLLFMILFISSFAQFMEDGYVKISEDIEDSYFSNSKIVAVDSGYYITWYNQTEGFKMYIQYIDPLGNLMWDEPQVVTDYPQEEWIIDYALVADNQFAYIFFSDIRNGSTDHDVFGYKFDANGNSLWGEAGVELATGDIDYDLEPHACIMSDGYIAVTWTRYSDEDQYVVTQRISPDGVVSWEGGISNPVEDIYRYNPIVSAFPDGNILLTYIHQEGGAYGDRQIFADVIKPDGTSLWDESVVVCSNTGIGMGGRFNASSSQYGGAYVYWYGDPDFNDLNDVFTQYIDETGALAFDAAGLNLGVDNTMNQSDVHFAGENSSGNAVFVWYETDESYTQNILKMQITDLEGTLYQGSSGLQVSDEVSNIYGAEYQFNKLYVYGALSTNYHTVILTNNLYGDVAYAELGGSMESVSGFSNGQFVATSSVASHVWAVNCTFDLQHGYEAVQGESRLYSFAGLESFDPLFSFYYQYLDGEHATSLNPLPMNIYQDITILDTLTENLGNYKLKVIAGDSSENFYMYSLVDNYIENQVIDVYNEGMGQELYIDNNQNIVIAQFHGAKEENVFFQLFFELSPGARMFFDGEWDPVSTSLNNALDSIWEFKADIDSAFLNFEVKDYGGGVEDWTLLTIVASGSVLENDFNGNIYPNPANDVLNIESKELIQTIELVDATGRTMGVYKFNNRNALLPVNHLITGVYYMKIHTTESVGVARFIKN